MKTNSLSRSAHGFTFPDLLVSATVSAVLAAGMLTTITALRKTAAASDHHAQSQVQQARLIDYMSRDLRRGIKVSVDTHLGAERLNVAIPNYYDASGGPREPIIDGKGGVQYGEGDVAIAYFKEGGTVYRSVNGAGTVLATGLDKFKIDYTDHGQQAVTIAVSFVPQYQNSAATAATAQSATTTYATTLLRNKRQ